jgi:hypothetical protein
VFSSRALRAGVLLIATCALAFAAGAAAPAHNARAQTGTDGFLAAVTLSSSDVPSPLLPGQRGAITADQVAAQSSDPAVASVLAAAGFQTGYVQAFQNPSRVSLLTGAPLGAASVVGVFSSADGADAWQSYEVQNAATDAGQIATAAGVPFTMTDATPLTIAGLGDQSAAVEVTGTTQYAGLSVPVVIDIAFIQRGSVQYTLIVAGLNRQQQALESLAATLDARVTSAMPLLAGQSP